MSTVCKCRLLWTQSSSLLSAVRVPLISFPSRKSPDGKHDLDIDKLNRPTSATKPSSGIHSQTLKYDKLSVNYGRSPLSEVEINVINSGGVIDSSSYR